MATAVPRYRIERELGRGGMGVVFAAVRESDGLAVALKTILPAAGTSQKQIDRFLRECRILSQLEHPNIVGCREVAEAGPVPFLAMDLEDGPDLEGWLRERGPQDVPTAVRIVCQMLKGLAHAHQKGYVHWDIKPGNVLIGRGGAGRVAKLADFGLARVYETSRISGVTLQGDIGGTPAYMAPEQVTHYRTVEPAADQYSAAATLYRMLTGFHTHDFPKEIGAQLSHLVAADPVPIRRRRPELPETLADAIHRALSREPEDRYPDVAAFRQQLKRFAGGNSPRID